MCVPRKPWPFGNEWHSICCGITGIMYAVELVEGKDEPTQRPKKYATLGKTVSLLLRLTESIWGTSRLVILDSGFCVLEGILALRERGVFASALIKKRRYWPKNVDGEAIIRHFSDKTVGDIDALLGCHKGRNFHIYGMKEPDYVMQLMSTYGTLERHGPERTRVISDTASGLNTRLKFCYPEVVYNHYQYRDAVDSHNAQRMYPIALEEVWKTSRWSNRVFQFLLAVTEVNTRLALKRIYNQNTGSQQEFRRSFAHALIFNHYYETEKGIKSPTRQKRRRYSQHSLVSLPPYKTFQGANIVKCKTKYIQLKCSSCPKRTRTYCQCCLGVPLCKECFTIHCMDVSTPSSF